jgi:hypothetical protein
MFGHAYVEKANKERGTGAAWVLLEISEKNTPSLLVPWVMPFAATS